jgi:hypothetical protein
VAMPGFLAGQASRGRRMPAWASSSRAAREADHRA